MWTSQHSVPMFFLTLFEVTHNMLMFGWRTPTQRDLDVFEDNFSISLNHIICKCQLLNVGFWNVKCSIHWMLDVDVWDTKFWIGWIIIDESMMHDAIVWYIWVVHLSLSSSSKKNTIILGVQLVIHLMSGCIWSEHSNLEVFMMKTFILFKHHSCWSIP